MADDGDLWRNPNPHDLDETAAYELCRELSLEPRGLCQFLGFIDDYNINWARWEIEKAKATIVALGRASPLILSFDGILTPEQCEKLERAWRGRQRAFL